ncbi:LysR family transcriptional regulator [Nocardioides sp. C4-1]|uniref:LysR family transcriptional regulator n=1 Tax=Nocardioides sp. C4-1 TaxID=3151851 RepID=UPI003267D6E7
MDVRRLRLLHELSRHGSMAEVAAEVGTTTSNVSQAIAALARDVGTPLVEPHGRRVRLTPAGRRLSEHAVGILAAVDAARRDLDPDAEPQGTVRVAGFATAVRRSLVPALDTLADVHPGVEVLVLEHEPWEAFDLLERDAIDLALVYDYDLAPLSWRSDVVAVPLWTTPWGLGVPSDDVRTAAHPVAAYAESAWIVNSRNSADEDALRTLASIAGFEPRVTHRIDSLSLVEDLVVAGRGVALLPTERTPRDGVRLLDLDSPGLELRAHAVTRRGRDRWAPLRAVLDHLTSA